MGKQNLTTPWFGYYGEPVCDADGDMFFHSAGVYNDVEVFELSHNGDTGTLFRIPSDLASQRHYADFAVSPSGTLYALTETYDDLYVLSFKSDGTVQGETRLEAPARLTGETRCFR